MNKLSLSASIALAAVIGIVVGVVVDPLLPAPISSAKHSYQSGFAAAQALVEQSSVGGMIAVPSEMHTLTGTVSSVGNGTFVLHTILRNPFDTSTPIDRMVTVTTATKIVLLEPKNSVAFQAEMTRYMDAVKTGHVTASTTTPTPFTESSVQITDLRAGDAVAVTSNENIVSVQAFTATSVQIQPHEQVVSADTTDAVTHKTTK